MKYTSIASAVLLVDTEVFFVAFATLFFFREKIPRKAWIGILVTFVGSVIVGMGDAGGGSDAVRG
ncbi:MAG: EamA family transporter, partial [Lachnospiraceae bacterium]|nr:EamA family transporter [Lachnospiraceae bacterium]